MVKTRQRRMTIFEFQEGTTQEILRYIQHNRDLLQNHCLAFHVMPNQEVESLLRELQINYFIIQNQQCFQSINALKDSITSLDSVSNAAISYNKTYKAMSFIVDDNNEEEKVVYTSRHADTNAMDASHNQDNIFSVVADSSLLPCKIFKRPIRSGEELVLRSHNVFLRGINAGAFIRSYGNLEIYGKCEGTLECLGEYIIIRQFTMGRISLQGINLERKMLESLKENNEVRMIFIENATIRVITLTEYN
ncbi:hypothetical protein CQA66_04415 [Helicobacter aurati]|uniref:Septum site-determining protein MinC n=1 Tax=Helicobacter aurati TaxID=137778 RepID=A0A3D8J5W0_9HELI|nr:hypothetical protein [Helicobacter aurati]RDU72555.1 hypothetical protein CQA66_04415 [Helicobacter aurati]